MTKKQFQAAFDLARSGIPLFDLLPASFDGFALPDFKPVTCTLHQLAALIKWQCQTLTGEWISEYLDEIWTYRQRFIVLDD